MAPGPLHATPRARLDLRDCANHLADHASPNVALRFLECAAATFAVLADNPGIGRQMDVGRPGLGGMRAFRIRGFANHLIFYMASESSGVEVVRVLHGARDWAAILGGSEAENEGA